MGIVLTGFVVGVSIGLTGMGGALIMTPLLILLFGFPPIVAVGTDLIFASITKLFGAVQHFMQRTVHFKLVCGLLSGSIPGGIAGVLLLRILDSYSTNGVDQFLGQMLGMLFIGISIVMFYALFRRNRLKSPPKNIAKHKHWSVGLGCIGGFLVGITSIGSGSIFVAILLIMSALPASKLVGTDIVHAFFLTLSTGLLHAFFGHVDWGFVTYLLIGSIPGILLGSRLTVKIPEWVVRSLLISVLLLTGFHLTF